MHINLNRLNRHFSAIILSTLLWVPFGFHSSVMAQSISTKITFDIAKISPDGLVGKPDALRSLSYEFCIPSSQPYLAEVEAIDPTVQFYPNSRGRIGCQREQTLCIGNTHNPQWQKILFAIADLQYVDRIDEFFGE